MDGNRQRISVTEFYMTYILFLNSYWLISYCLIYLFIFLLHLFIGLIFFIDLVEVFFLIAFIFFESLGYWNFFP